MSWAGIIPALLGPAKELALALKPEAEGAPPRQGHLGRPALSARDLAALEQFAAALRPRRARTRWDAFINGLNRVPRPLITLGAVAFLMLAPFDPARFARIARAYELMPDGFWALLSVIVAFYFGGRMQLQRQELAVKGDALALVREVLALQRAAREQGGHPAEPTMAAAPPRAATGAMEGLARTGAPNGVIVARRRQRPFAAGG